MLFLCMWKGLYILYLLLFIMVECKFKSLKGVNYDLNKLQLTQFFKTINKFKTNGELRVYLKTL